MVRRGVPFFVWIFLFLWSYPSRAFQFDEMDSNDPTVETEATEDSATTTKGQVEITNEDLRALDAAQKAGLEPQLTAAAANILGKDSNHLKALNALGVHYFVRKNFGLAKIIFLRAIAAHPSEPALHNNLGIVYLAEGDQRAAIGAFKKSLEARESYVIGATNLASIYLEYHDFNRALTPLASGYKVVKSGLRDGKEESIGVANNLAVALSAQGQGEKARDIYEEIGRGSSRNITVLLNYAILLTERLKAKDDALRVISKIKFVADDPRAIRRAEELEKKLKSQD